MCKTQPGNCQPEQENLPAFALAEDPVTTEDEDGTTDTDESYYTTSSSDEDEYVSDVESASGNRVTTDMVVWYMLKDQGLISEEKYAEKADINVENMKSFIPKIPKSKWGMLNSDQSDSDENDKDRDVFEERLYKIIYKNKDSLITSNGMSANQEMEIVAPIDVDTIENEGDVIEKNNENADANIAEKDTSKQNPNFEEVTALGPLIDTNSKGIVEAIESSHNHQRVIEIELNDSNGDEKHVVFIQNQTIPENPIDNAENEVMTHNEVYSEIGENQGCNLDESGKELADVERNVAEGKQDQEVTNIDMKKESTSIDHKISTNKETRSFKYILEKLVEEKRIETDFEYVDVLETYVKDLDKHYKSNEAVDLFDTPTRDLKQFALFLNFYSPSSYEYVTETFNTPLPEHKVLSSWYLQNDVEPGLSRRAFEILKKKACNKRLTCALMSRDIFLTNFGFNYDQVDYGGGCNFEYTDKAVMAFVFVLVSLDEDWKIPIGYVFARHMPAESQAGLIRVCLSQCYDAGADVVAITLQTPTPAKFLGCSFEDLRNLKTTFKHPDCDREVAVWIDPCLALRSARHTLKAKTVLLDDVGNKIRWNLIRKLRKLHSDDSLDFNNPKSLKLRNHIAKVGLTTEIFSDSLVPALTLAEELLPDSFKNIAPTCRYIQKINTLYDILNSKTITKLSDVEQYLDSAKEYIMSLFFKEENNLSRLDKENFTADKKLINRSFVGGEPVCGYIGFLICIASLKHLYNDLVVNEQRMERLNTHRLCKDHAEDVVLSLRAYRPLIEASDCGGWLWQAFYYGLLEDFERDPRFNDDIPQMEHWPLKNKYTPAVTINLTSGKRAYDEVYSHQYRPKKLPRTSHEDRATKLVREYSKALDTEMDLSSRKNMVGYLAGWIAAKFARNLKCEACVDALCTDKKSWFHKFITSKDVRGVCLPSEEVFRVCWECERALRTRGSAARLRVWVLRRLQPRLPWRRGPAQQPLHRPHHYLHLVRAVIARYIPLRIPAPFSAQESSKVVDMFRLFSGLSKSGFLEQLRGSHEDEED